MEMEQAAQVHRLAFDHALPWLTGLHTLGADRWFSRERIFKACTLSEVFHGEAMTGIIAFRNDWTDQLYVLSDKQGRGVGSELLQVAKAASAPALDIPAQRARPALL
jgi:GNAT superfamily N-acetyltransferase